MSKIKDLTGHKFGRLTVLRLGERSKSGRIMWECVCECGSFTPVVAHQLVSGDTKSCGCYKSEVLSKRVVDLTGKKFGRLTVVKQGERSKLGAVRWVCECDCGNETAVHYSNLVRGTTRSCGCRSRNHKHGRTGSKVFSTFHRMKNRCDNKTHHKYPDYGGRGIKVCDRWQVFENFLEDMGEPPTNNHSIDRIDVNGNYEPANCRWATPKQQGRNRRNNHLITFNGATKCLSEWAELAGLLPNVLSSRVKLGWDFERALTTPVRR